MYEYIYEKLNIEFPELTVDGKTRIYQSHIPDNRLNEDVIVYSVIRSDITYHSKMSTIQISCYSNGGAGALKSINMSNRVVKIFQNMRITGKALSSKVLSTTDMLYDKDSDYYGTHVEILLQSTKEFV